MAIQVMRKVYKYALALMTIQVMALAGFIFHVMAGPTIIGEYLNGSFKDDLKFTFNRCDDGSKAFKDAISKSYWVENELIIDGVVVLNCGASWMFGDYQLNGSNLVLKYKPVYSALMLCTCAQDVQYKITGIGKQDYKISIIEEGALIVEATWYHKLFTSEQ